MPRLRLFVARQAASYDPAIFLPNHKRAATWQTRHGRVRAGLAENFCLAAAPCFDLAAVGPANIDPISVKGQRDILPGSDL